MKRVSLFIVFALVFGVSDFASAASGRLGVQQNTMSARMPSIPVATVGTVTASNLNNTPPSSVGKFVPKTEQEQQPEKEPEKPAVDTREKEREACIRNNIGVGNTFVWASRYSDIGNYATMIEDTETPENNACFVRVDVKSSDSRIDLSWVPGKYFEMGRNITCGAWVDEDKVEQAILDAKKKGRTWATVGGAVGGAALGVGAMELFGNRLIGGKVQGQQNEKEQQEVLYYQLVSMKTSDADKYNKFALVLKSLDKACENASGKKECTEFDGLLERLQKSNK